MRAAIWVQDSFRALPRYLLVLTAVSALALLARAAVPSFDDARAARAAASASSASALSGPAPLTPALSASTSVSAPVSTAVAPYPAQIAATPIPAFAAHAGPIAALRPDSHLPPDYLRYATATQAPLAETR
ncbi:hypothetical protein [Lysobacter enzymogenes]|uniref:hypothetical protein n=1 Tax=Lysobacter enzymogenes TaxID=69 RepID=UPI001A96F953|nr:hypothetical protein [Lysobacter enzymogenes]QQP98040.1 hypothetical protein JHW38_08570 [Lysobacter enzymogenes]